MSKEIEVTGKNVKITTNFSEQTISQGKYDSNSNTTKVDHSINDIRESGTNKTSDYKGNVQTICDGFGEKMNSHVKIVGTPEMFDSKNYKILNNALAKLGALSLQVGDNRFSLPSEPIITPNLETTATSDYQVKHSLTPPQLNSISDINTYLLEVSKWFVNLHLDNAKEKLKIINQLNLERNERQQQITKERNELDGTLTSDYLNNNGSPANEDKVNVTHNITRKDLYEAYLENIDTILAAQSKIS